MTILYHNNKKEAEKSSKQTHSPMMERKTHVITTSLASIQMYVCLCKYLVNPLNIPKYSNFAWHSVCLFLCKCVLYASLWAYFSFVPFTAVVVVVFSNFAELFDFGCWFICLRLITFAKFISRKRRCVKIIIVLRLLLVSYHLSRN